MDFLEKGETPDWRGEATWEGREAMGEAGGCIFGSNPQAGWG